MPRSGCSALHGKKKQKEKKRFLPRAPQNFYPFYLGPPQKILNLSDPSRLPPIMSNAPQNFGERDPHLKCTLVQESKDSFFKETKDFISNNEITHLNVEI